MSPRRQLGLLWGGVAAALVALSPLASRLAGLLPPCPLKTFTGVPCPGCGTTRAALALGRLDVLAAFTVSPLAAAAWVLLVGGGLAAGALALAGREPPAPPRLSGGRERAFRIAVAGALVANWIYLIYSGA
jgi:hypothetical protein